MTEVKTQVCPTPNCGNLCEVKVSTGHNKPENKGKEYITCPKCDQFSWVGLTSSETPKLPPTPAMKPAGTPTNFQDSKTKENLGMMKMSALKAAAEAYDANLTALGKSEDVLTLADKYFKWLTE